MNLDPEDWIKAEEAALRALEAEVADKRKSVSLVSTFYGLSLTDIL
jgi:hypothetical protein